MIGINPDYDFLYDPQQAMSRGKCQRCGAEVWVEGRDLCNRCAVYTAEREPDLEEEYE